MKIRCKRVYTPDKQLAVTRFENDAGRQSNAKQHRITTTKQNKQGCKGVHIVDILLLDLTEWNDRETPHKQIK